MSKLNEIKDLVQKLDRAFVAGRFTDHIEYIRFPRFKNLRVNERLTFDFPVTVITGLNGSGKSSALHAIYGTPEGKSTAEFWFSTKVDPIEDKDGAPNCYIYGYLGAGGIMLEVLKTRVGQSKGADYWETSRPLKKYGMQRLPEGKRNPAVIKDVVYLDFRAALSAFDKFFYFGNFRSTATLKNKQDVLRKYSAYLKRAIDTDRVISSNKRKNKVPELLTAAELTAVSGILGKSYRECKILAHNFYGRSEGETVYYRTDSLNYSEAFAGRGEFAVVKLVHDVSRAADGSLIILDEPEVSLHPGAQEELKLFLLREALKKKLQIVISTHSPVFVEHLPDKCIKLFFEDAAGKTGINNHCSPLEAFSNLGIDVQEGEKNIIIVEDTTAKMILDAVLNELGQSYVLAFTVKFFPGGAEEIYKKAATYSEEDELHKFMLLDGDKKKIKFNPEEFSRQEAGDLAFVKQKVQEETNVAFEKMGFRVDGGTGGGDPEQKREACLRYLKFLWTNMDYLPSHIPEELIWNEDFVKGYLDSDALKTTRFTDDYKENVLLFAEKFFGDRSESSQTSAKKLLIKHFIKSKNAAYQSLAAILEVFKENARV